LQQTTPTILIKDHCLVHIFHAILLATQSDFELPKRPSYLDVFQTQDVQVTWTFFKHKNTYLWCSTIVKSRTTLNFLGLSATEKLYHPTQAKLFNETHHHEKAETSAAVAAECTTQ
jgi:hypothetical protein